jgi:hypothetical protein
MCITADNKISKNRSTILSAPAMLKKKDDGLPIQHLTNGIRCNEMELVHNTKIQLDGQQRPFSLRDELNVKN